MKKDCNNWGADCTKCDGSRKFKEWDCFDDTEKEYTDYEKKMMADAEKADKFQDTGER